MQSRFYNDINLKKAADAVQKISMDALRKQDRWPWRISPSPYRVFLAEFLLVRTRADVVAKIFDGVVEMYPDIESLSNAAEAELSSLLYPLGMSKRTPYLIRAACFIRDNYGGNIPCEVSELKKIPGIGNYTATAIAAFACNARLIPGDVNIFRFFSRLTGLEMIHKTKGSQELQDLIEKIPDQCTDFSVGTVLDFSREVCRPRKPLCQECLLNDICNFSRTHIV